MYASAFPWSAFNKLGLVCAYIHIHSTYIRTIYLDTFLNWSIWNSKRRKNVYVRMYVHRNGNKSSNNRILNINILRACTCSYPHAHVDVCLGVCTSASASVYVLSCAKGFLCFFIFTLHFLIVRILETLVYFVSIVLHVFSLYYLYFLPLIISTFSYCRLLIYDLLFRQ